MKMNLKNVKWDKVGLFAGGVLFGTAGLKILGSDDAKRAYVHTTAAVLRAKETVMTTATNLKENADDILEDAKIINEIRAEEAAEAMVDWDDACAGCEADEALHRARRLQCTESVEERNRSQRQ